MTTLTTAELRGYQQICGKNGSIMVIACDQRGGIRKILASTPAEQAKITDTMLGDTKSDVVRYLASQAPCVLLDPVCAVPRVVEEAALPRDVALLIGLDASGYDTDASGHYLSRLAPGINARKVRELGGTGGKIMVYLRADHPEANRHNMAIIHQCIEDFAKRRSAACRRVPDLRPPRRGRGGLQDQVSLVDRRWHAALSRRRSKGAEASLPGNGAILCGDHRHVRFRSVVGSLGWRRSRDLHGSG